MKSIRLFSIGCLMAIAFAFASCSTSIDIAKRHYNKGYYVHVSKKNPSGPEIKSHDNEKLPHINSEIIEYSEMADKKNGILFSDKNIIKPREKFTKQNENNSESLNNHEEKVSFVPSLENSYRHADKYAAKKEIQKKIINRNGKTSFLFKDNDVPTIVLILLCIFLPFIAVGIVDDWGNRFWISLLLCILFWIPGVIYAFIVCFS